MSMTTSVDGPLSGPVRAATMVESADQAKTKLSCQLPSSRSLFPTAIE
jgi:hypothetical protein